MDLIERRLGALGDELAAILDQRIPDAYDGIPDGGQPAGLEHDALYVLSWLEGLIGAARARHEVSPTFVMDGLVRRCLTRANAVTQGQQS